MIFVSTGVSGGGGGRLLSPPLSAKDLVLPSELVEGVRATLEESGEAAELRARRGGVLCRVHLVCGWSGASY